MDFIFRIILTFFLCSFTVAVQASAEVGQSPQEGDSVAISVAPVLVEVDEKVVDEQLVVENDSVAADSEVQDRRSKRELRRKEFLLEKDYFKPDAKRATWYALVCPGLGQIYNRSYWKLPILYGGILTFSYFIGWNGRMYNEYHNAYRDILDNDPLTCSYEKMVSDYTGDQEWLKSTLKSRTNRYRRYRDICAFGVVAFYLVSVIDAFVDAHLYDFTVTDDLSMRVEPVLNMYDFGKPALEDPKSMVLGVQCSFQFK